MTPNVPILALDLAAPNLAAAVVMLVVGLGVGGGVALMLAGARRAPLARPGTDSDPGSNPAVDALRTEVRVMRDTQITELDRVREATINEILTTNRHLQEQQHQRVVSELDGRRSAIDASLGAMHGALNERMAEVTALVRSAEADRHLAFGRITQELERQHDGVNSLVQTTQSLREALASQKTRGQWGERMAEDVLALSGLLEGVNYRKQSTLTSVDGVAGRPDFTFLLPNSMLLHMDVKFPLENYVRFLDATTDLERQATKSAFLKDVRARVAELTKRGYLDDANATVDCLLLFIPNEAVFAFIQEHDHAIAEEALRNRIVICSPLTLYAVLAVIRQAVSNFRLEQRSDEILKHLGAFEKQWNAYVDKLDTIGKRLDSVHKEYDSLMSTRHRALERPLDKIRALRDEAEPEITLLDDASVCAIDTAPAVRARSLRA